MHFNGDLNSIVCDPSFIELVTVKYGLSTVRSFSFSRRFLWHFPQKKEENLAALLLWVLN